MHCPRCEHPEYRPPQPCPGCQFSGDPSLIEELDHINWLLEQVNGWPALGVASPSVRRAQEYYSARRRQIEISLGLRPPPFTAEEIRTEWPRCARYEALLQSMDRWGMRNLLAPAAAEHVRLLEQEIALLRERLGDAARPLYPSGNEERLEVVNFLIRSAEELGRLGAFLFPSAAADVVGPLQAEQERLEVLLGLRAAPEPPPTPHPAPEVRREPPRAAPPPAAPAPLAPPPPPSAPLRERPWRALLSERALHAILFLGVFLLFAAAISFVVWGWRGFSAGLRVAIPAGFTLLFFAMGWAVRARTALYRSGIALSAIAALLIPVDAYTVYVNLIRVPEHRPWFWLAASLVCVAAYLASALRVQTRFFGYLVGVACGSTVLAGVAVANQEAGFSWDWSSAALSLLAAGLLGAGLGIGRLDRPGRWQVLADSLPTLALGTVGVLMPLTLGWRAVDRAEYDTLHNAVIVNWWVGSLVLGWAAIAFRSRTLGLVTGLGFPVAVYLTQAALFHQLSINAAWHAFGLAWLAPPYLAAGRRLVVSGEDPILQHHGRSAIRLAAVLTAIALVWPFADLASGLPASCTHAVLAGTAVLAARFWRKPRYLYGASLLALSSLTLVLGEAGLTVVQMCVGWTSLALVHLLLAYRLSPSAGYARPLVVSACVLGAIAALFPLAGGDKSLAAYTWANWLGMSSWGAYLLHQRRPGFDSWPRATFHWMVAFPLPVWLWITLTSGRPPGPALMLTLAAFSWGMIALGGRLARSESAYRLPWRLAGFLTAAAAPAAATILTPDSSASGWCLLSAGLLLFADAIRAHRSPDLAPAGLVTAWGVLSLVSRLLAPPGTSELVLAALVALYLLAGIELARRRIGPFTLEYLDPLHWAAHLLAVVALFSICEHPVAHLVAHTPWADLTKVLGASSQLLLGAAYAVHAWARYQEPWAHVAAWLVAAGGGFLAIAYSQGRGSSAAKAALMAIGFVLAERLLHHVQGDRRARRHLRAVARLAWRLYRRPLLVTGWTVSAGAILLALVRNLLLLGGGRVQQTWAVIGLLMVTGVYAISARLFRQARFSWLASLLVFAPWTILTNLGWFIPRQPSLPGFAISWLVLAWVLFLLGRAMGRPAPATYSRPPSIVAQALIPFALLWGMADVATGRLTFGLAVALYSLAAWLEFRRWRSSRPLEWPGGVLAVVWSARFLYPALGLIPVWAVYLLSWPLPGIPYEHYGLLLLGFCPLGLIAGQGLEHLRLRVARDTAQAGESRRRDARLWALPSYLTGFAALVVGTTLVAHIKPLLALALLYDAILMLLSARIFREPIWTFPAAALAPVSLLIALPQAGISVRRQGWWLIGLAALYLALATLLRRARLARYGDGPLIVGFALIALGLPPSSRDQIGALWGYTGASLLYTLSAFWLRQPLLLVPGCALVVVPYAVALQRLPLAADYYGLALLPGALLALLVAWILDRWAPYHEPFPWSRPDRWPSAAAGALLSWWGLPFHLLGFGLASAGPFVSGGRWDLVALNFALLAIVLGWGLYRFRRRGWLLVAGCSAQLAVASYIEYTGWTVWTAPFSWRFLPVTFITAALALTLEKRRAEGPPTDLGRLAHGWSRPLYALLAVDLVVGQLFSLSGTAEATMTTVAHAALVAILSSAWSSAALPYVATLLGAVALLQRFDRLGLPSRSTVVGVVALALGYGALGSGLRITRQHLKRLPGQLAGWFSVWQSPLEVSGLVLSAAALCTTAVLAQDVAGWTVRALLGMPFRHVVELQAVQLVVRVLSLSGLLYLAMAVAHRRPRWGYPAIGMLLASWSLYAFFVQEWGGLARLQWYAVPAGLYLLAIGYVEWHTGNKSLARGIDYASLVLIIGSAFWQTLALGWLFALQLGIEGLALLWWGSGRRLRRFFYGGILGVMLATIGQLVNALQSINQWLVFGIVGLILFLVGALGERRLEELRASFDEILEEWE